MIDNKGFSWSNQRRLKEQDIPTPQQIYEMICQIGGHYPSRDRAVIAALYLSGARVTEIVRRKYSIKNEFKKEIRRAKDGIKKKMIVYNEQGSPTIKKAHKEIVNEPSILKRNIEITEHHGKKILTFEIRNRKNPRSKRKRIPINLEKNARIAKFLLNFMKNFQDEEEIFRMQAYTVRRILKPFGINPHFLRDIRLTHLVKYNEFNAFELQRVAGWSDTKPAQAYVQLSIADLVRKL